jgi:hypothetical protein
MVPNRPANRTLPSIGEFRHYAGAQGLCLLRPEHATKLNSTAQKTAALDDSTLVDTTVAIRIGRVMQAIQL